MASIPGRLAQERREDPLAARQQRRQWWLGALGWLAGALAAGWATAHAVSTM